MSRPTEASDAEALARWSLIQAAWPIAAMAAVLLAALLYGSLAPLFSAGSGLARTALTVALVSGTIALGLSVLLAFDALLFRVIASYEDDMKGGAAVDDLLARMRLKPLPDRTRPLPERATGTRRLALRQRLAFGIFLAAWAYPALAPVA